MFIFNFHLNKKKFIKIFIVAMIILVTIIFILSLSRILKSSQLNIKSNISENPKTLDITSNNYTNFLRDCHDNIDNYVGTIVTISGYVYRMPDFNSCQFVLARTMILNSSNQAVVVGILCECENASNYENNIWVSCKGQLAKGDYKGEMPVLKVNEMTKAERPEDEYVYPPSD